MSNELKVPATICPGGYRVEHDSMGEVFVPETAWYGSQTMRAVENFPISGQPLPASLLRALVWIKQAAALANLELGVINPDIANAIVEAAQRVAAELDTPGFAAGQFPIDIYQTGSGTSSNMNANEVLAHLASATSGALVHPNDHVNASQSSNDVFPTAIRLAAAHVLENALLPSLADLQQTLEAKAEEFHLIVKSGRTHLMDATPVTLGQEFAGYAAALSICRNRLQTLVAEVATVPLGGTAVGTGINTPPGFTAAAIDHLAEISGLPVTEAANHMAAQWSQDELVALSSALKSLAITLTKICNDLRWMGSGPNTGLAEINIPDLQPGSSIMPGKVNPVIPESVLMVCARVIGNDATAAWAAASGNFELNVQLPVLAVAVLESLELLAQATKVLADMCISGLTANTERCLQFAGSSPSIVTALNPLIGYEKAATVAKFSVANRIPIRDAVIEMGLVDQGLLTLDQLDARLDLLQMTNSIVKPG
jgi:fumarate hydratase class II